MCLILCLVLLFGTLSHNTGQRKDGFSVSFATAAGDNEDSGSHTLDLTRPDEGYSAVLYNNMNGLPTSEANAIVQSEEGFIWIGSYSGLIRYDGNTFERMDSTDGIASVVSLFLDSKNRLWVGTNDSGVAVIDKDTIKMFRMKDGLKSMSVRAITEDKKGNIYVATTRGVAEIDEGMMVRTLENVSIRDEYIRELLTGPDGVIYGLTQEGLVFTLENGTVSGSYGVKDPKDPEKYPIISVNPDPDKPGYVYIGSDGVVFYGKLDSNLNNYERIDVSPLGRVNEVNKLENMLWFCTDIGIGYKVDDAPITVLDNVPMRYSVDHMIGDYLGDLWFSSSRQGVMKLVRNRFVDISAWCDLPDMVVNSTCVYEDKLLLGTDSGLTVIKDMATIKDWEIKSIRTNSDVVPGGGKTNLIELLKGSRIRSIIRDSKNRLWFSTYSEQYGLMRYDNGEIVCFTKADGMPSERIRAVCECKDGSMLVACTGALVSIVTENGEDKVVTILDEESGLRNPEILTVAEGPKGECVIGTDGGGIYVWDSGVLHRISTDTGLSSDVVMRIKWDARAGVFWIVTSNSLAYMNRSYEVTTIKKFPYSNNFDIYTNSQGEVWILSSNGVYVTSAEVLIANGDIDPVFYSHDNGLPYVATANSYSALTEDGDLYIAGSAGVARVNIENKFENVNELKMSVPYVVADGVNIYPDEDGTFVIPSGTKKLVIHSFVYTYSLINPQVTYWLEGFERGSTTVSRTELGPVSYTNLRNGTYYFKLKIQDAFDVETKELSVRIVKPKAVYETWWFQLFWIIASALFLCRLVQLYVGRKTLKLIEKEQEQKTFINEMTEAFAKTIDMKDSYTNGHSFRVAKYTTMLAEELGYSQDDIEKYHNIALLHDIGKIGVDDKVLNKAGKLDDDEFKQIKSHAYRGYEVLKDISIMPELAIGAGAHHERPDGKGYPKGLKGDEIPRVAQIIAVADTFDAMYSDRPYRKRMNFEKAVSIIRDASGTQLAEDVVDAFLRLVDKGLFRAPDDEGGGTSEDIDNIHKSFARAQAIKEAHMPAAQKQEDKPAEEDKKE